MLVLKKLSEAERDGDHIYAVIRSSAENHGGRASSLTAPNPKAQADVLIAAYRKAGIDPRTVGYIEAHGTGTALGDPIEINALKTAFSELAQWTGEESLPQAWCGIGSVKSNIGHLELAAGVAGVIKVLLQMQHKTLVKSLHCEQLNPYIQLEASPFYIVQENHEWVAPQDSMGTPLPRRAGVSSFGYGGVNAHVVLEEYVSSIQGTEGEASSPVYPALILLSAKNEERLYEQAKQLLAWVQEKKDAEESQRLQDVAYTLQVGRSPMEERLAMPVGSFTELEEKLSRYLQEPPEGRDWYRGQVRQHKETVALLSDDEELQEAIGKWLQRGKYEKLLQWWVKGLAIDWKLLYTRGGAIGTRRDSGLPLSACPCLMATALPRRISLPTYPFARQRYWILTSPPVTVETEPYTCLPMIGNFDQTRTALLIPNWKEEEIAPLSLSQEAPLPSSGKRTEASPAHFLVLLCEPPEDSNPLVPNIEATRIQAQLGAGGHCHSLSSSQRRRELRFQDMMLQLLQELERLLRSRSVEPVLVQVVVVHTEEPSLLEALIAVLKVAQQEYPKLRGQLIEVDKKPEEGELLAWLRENQLRPHEPHILYRDGKRWVREWRELTPVTTPGCQPWKEGGCYLISGGAGGLARLFVDEIARQVQEATVILVSRSALSREQQAQLERAGKGYIRIDYQQVDVSDGPAVRALMQKVLAQYGHLNGIIHAAGVHRKNLLLNKTKEEVQAVLAPKVIGVELLDEASSQMPLDFFILCSSLTAIVGGAEHADYAGANAYLDAFAHARQAQVMRRERQGTTVSINWPYWEAGGIQIEAEMIQMMWELLGQEPMGTETGVRALYQALTSGFAQVMVLHGEVERIKRQLLRRFPVLPVETASIESTTRPDRNGGQAQGALPTDKLREGGQAQGAIPTEKWGEGGQAQGAVPTDRLRGALTHMVCNLLKVRVEEIDAETDLSEYGFDSIAFTKLANHLNKTYQLDLTPTLFYEYSTLEQLTQYLHTTYAPILASHFAVVTPPVVTSKDRAPDETSPTVPVSRQHSHIARPSVRVPDPHTEAEPIAIIGMSGAFPQAPDVQSLWRNLLEGKDCMSEIPPSRWDWQAYFGNPATEANKTNIKWAGIVEDVECFDPQFFGISPREAEQMDPQQRLLMMYVWKAIEDAGYAASSLSGTNTALFIGTAFSGYSERVSRANMAIEGYSSTSQVPSVGPNRMSYFLNLHGPSEPVETSCSSSLVAIHRGVNAIASGQCSMAIVGGVNVIVSPDMHISFSKAGMLSSDGRCKTFSAQANGYARGEGVGMLVLKKRSDAEQDGDHIYALIRSSAENHGGRARSLTAPNPRAQADLLIAAYRQAEIDPRTVGYIEAHGTGTTLGDPIEINGLKIAFNELAPIRGEEPMPLASCGIGSIKSNLGHLELAAGVAGVIKVLLQLQHKKLVKSLHCEQLNPYIELKASPFYIVQENREWEAPRDHAGHPLPRRAGVSSFGFGGVNAHVVLEEYMPKKPSARLAGSQAIQPLSEQAPRRGQAPPLLVALSAKNETRLHEQVRQLLAWVRTEMCAEEPQDRREVRSLRDLAYTLQVGREAMEERLALQVSSLAELEEKLHSYLQEPREGSDWYRGQVRRQDAISAFAADEDGQKAVAAWISKGKYEKLLELWVKGLTIDWKLLYNVGTAAAQDTGAAQGTIPTVPALPRRISLPTYPFARERYWIPLPPVGTVPCACPSASNSTATAPSPSPMESVHPQSSRVVLRSLADHPTPRSPWVDQSLRLPVPIEADQPLPSIPQSLSDQSFSQPGSNHEVSNRAHKRTALSTVDPELALGLEEELSRSLADALYMEQSAIDREKPFVEMGLDSVIGVAWVQFLNKKYAINLATSCVYDYPTIRQLADFLQKEALQLGGAIAQTPVQSTSTYQRVILERSGGIDDFIVSEAEIPELKDHEVRVAVRAFSLNFGDLLCVKGLYPTMPPYPFTPGFEASGVVLGIGRAVTDFQIGNPVIAMAGATLGAHATVMTCPEEHVFHKPAALSFEEACALPVVAITMIAAFEKARLKRGEKVLIHTATGGTGLIAIQLANYYRVEIYATAGSKSKLDYLKQLGVPYRINYQETDFEQEIKRLTGGQGIDVVINTLSGDALQKGINCLAPEGRYIEIAMTALKSARAIDLSVLSQNQTFYSVDLRKLALTNPAPFKHYWHEMFRFVEEGVITPTICQVFDWQSLKDAYRYMEDRQHIGKIVVSIPEANQAIQRTDSQRIGAGYTSQETLRGSQAGKISLKETSKAFTPGASPMVTENKQTALSTIDPELALGLEEGLSRSLADALYMEQSAIDREKPFVEMGLDSVIGVEWVQLLNKKYAINLATSCIYDYPTIRQLAGFLEKERVKNRPVPAQSISTFAQPTKRMTADLWNEATLDPAIAPTRVPPASTSVLRSILLTGATGFLGAFLLYDLLQQTSANISCLVRISKQGRRDSSLPLYAPTREAFQKLQTHLRTFGLWDDSFLHRISVVIGDLAQPQLGLSEEDWRNLAEQTDAIYHAGAWVNFMHPYSILKTVNVLGTQEILRLACLDHLKPVHFISTVAVFASSRHDPTHPILEDEPLNSCEELYTGYVESKWVAEKLVTEARSRGIPVSIYRPATVTGHSQTGAFNEHDFILRTLMSCIELKQAPDVHLPIYMTPVDYTSKAIVFLSQQPHLQGKAFNLIPSQPTGWQTLLDIARSFGYPMQATSFADWYASLRNLAQDGQETNLTPFLPLLQKNRMTPLPTLDCSNTLMGLMNTSLAFPPIDRELFSVYFDAFCRSGFLSH